MGANGMIRVGLVGAGVFGGYHAGKLAEAGVLAGVVDAEPARAEALADRHGARAFRDLDAMLAEVDAVVVAAPATLHAWAAGQALSAGRHVLVEKPVALTLAEADALVAAAASRGLVLQVGHQERYVADALGLLDRQGVRHVRSRRLNRPSGRGGDVSVVFDLMIHDLDLLARLAGTTDARVTACEAEGPREAADRVRVDLRVGPVTATLQASRSEETPVRDLALVLPDGQVALDFLTRTVANGTETPLAAEMGEGAPPALADPLGYGTRLFLDAIEAGEARGVTGREGRDALALALLVEDAVRSSS